MERIKKRTLIIGACLTAICAIIIGFFIGYVNIWIVVGLYCALAILGIFLLVGVFKNIEWLYKFIITCYYIGIIVLLVYGGIMWSGLYNKFYGANGKIKPELIAKVIGEQKGAEIIFVLLSFLQVTFIPIPSTVTIIVGTILFGAGKGFVLSLIGQLVGSMLAFHLGRYFGEKLIVWIIGRDAFDKYHKIIKGRDKIILFFMFLFPFFPDDILCMFAGLTTYTTITFFFIMLFTRSIAIGYTSFGIEALNSLRNLGVWTYVIYGACAIIFITLFVYVWKYGDKLEIKMLNFFDRITPKRFKHKIISEKDRALLDTEREKKKVNMLKKKKIKGKSKRKKNDKISDTVNTPEESEDFISLSDIANIAKKDVPISSNINKK